MAFSKVLSGGLADDAVSGDNIAPSAYLENSANQNLSGTISQNRMYTSDSYTLTGDLTVNDTIGLISASGNSTNVTVTTDGSTRTITSTGSGTVEGGELYSSTNSLSGMTGKLGSTVTGAPAITGLGTVTSGTLEKEVNFPQGHVLKTTLLVGSEAGGVLGSGEGSGEGDFRQYDISNTYINSSPTSNAWLDTTNYFKYTPLSSSNKLIIHYNFGLRLNSSGAHGYSYRWGITPAGSSEVFPYTTMAQLPSGNAHGYYDSATPGDLVHALTTTFYYDFSSAVSHTFKFYVAGYNWSYVAQGSIYSNNCQLLLQEIQG